METCVNSQRIPGRDDQPPSSSPIPFPCQISAMDISSVIQRIFKRLDSTRCWAALASNEDRTSIRKSATISSCIKPGIPIVLVVP